MFANQAELDAAKQRQATEDVDSFGSKAGMAARALGSATAKVGIPAAAIGLAPFTGGASLALGSGSAMLGEYIGNQIAGEETTPGGLVQAGILGATPMRSLPGATALQTIGTGLKVGAAGAAGITAKIGLDEQRLPTAGELAPSAIGAIVAPIAGKVLDSGSGAQKAISAASKESVARETLREGRKLGLGAPPSAIRPGIVNDALQSLAGKAATAQEQILKNQPKVNDAIRQSIYGDGVVATDAPFSALALNTARTGPNLVYDRLAKLTPTTGPLLENFKKATADANLARQAYQSSIDSGRRNVGLLEDAQAADAIADQMIAGLKSEASKVTGGNKLIQEFEKARIKLAQIGLTERAVNKGSGNVDPAVIGQALDHGEKLTGAFRTIGKFENAFGRYLKDAATTPPSGVDYLKLLAKGGLFGTGAATGNPALALGGPLAMTAAERGARGAILSPFYQNRFARPNYGPTTEDMAAGASRLAAMGFGR
jgi:hypothetical protein